MKNKKTKKNLMQKIFFALTLLSFFLKLAKLLLGKKRFRAISDNLKKFEKEEIKEILELAEGKESKEKYWHDSLGIFQEYFIPNRKNSHKPKILRTKSLVTIAFLLMFLKLTILSYVFFINPFEAWMSEAITSKVIEYINTDRGAQNIQSLSLNPILSASALKKANDMIEKGYFAHFTPDGKKPWDFIDRVKYPYLYVGENLAMNFSSADSVHQALMNSPTHKKNIMNSKYNEVGIAMVSGEIDGKKTNVLVQLFASKSQISPALDLKKEGDAKVLVKEPLESIKNLNSIAVEQKIQERKTQQSVKELEPSKVTKVAGLNEQYSSRNEKNEKPELIQEFSSYKNSEEIVESPNNSLENNEVKEVIKTPNSDIPRITFVSNIMKSLNMIFLGSLVALIMALILNILVRIRVQHKPVIVQTLILLLFIAGLTYWQFDLESLNITEIFIL